MFLSASSGHVSELEKPVVQLGNEPAWFQVKASVPGLFIDDGKGDDKFFFCPGGGHIKKSAFLFDIIVGIHALMGREESFGKPENIDIIPFKTLGLMNRGKENALFTFFPAVIRIGHENHFRKEGCKILI